MPSTPLSISALTRAASVALACLLGAAATPAALAQDRAGEAVSVRGTVSASTASGEERSLEEGAPIFAGDTLTTSRRSSVSIAFTDETTFDLGPSASMEVNDYVHGTAEESRFSARVLRGVFRFVTGLIAKSRPRSMSVRLRASGTIGIRGTHVVGEVEGEKATVILQDQENAETPGEIEVSNEHGAVTINTAGWGTEIPDAASPPSPPRRMQLRAIQNLMRTLPAIGRIGARPRI